MSSFVAPARLRSLALVALLGIAAAGCVDRAAEHRVRANAFLRGGDPAGALKECDLGLEAKKDNLPLLILRGKALFELDRLDEARTAFEGSIAKGQKEEPTALAEAYLGLAMIGSRQKDYPLARKYFEKLVAINDRDATSHLNVARTCLEMKDLPCAIEHGELAGRMRGDEEPVLFTLGTIYLAADKLKEAELTFQHICEVAPSAASCPYGVALVAAKAGDKPKALKELADAVRRKLPNPDNIAADPGFASLRDDPEFRAIVASAKP